MSHSKIPPVPPASRPPREPASAAGKAPREETPAARAAGPAERENIRQNLTNQGHQQDR
jgi:hypothetical protein